MEPMTLYPTLSTECCEKFFSLREPRFSEGRCFLGVTRRKSRALGLSSGPSVTRHYSYLSVRLLEQGPASNVLDGAEACRYEIVDSSDIIRALFHYLWPYSITRTDFLRKAFC